MQQTEHDINRDAYAIQAATSTLDYPAGSYMFAVIPQNAHNAAMKYLSGRVGTAGQ